MCVSADLPKTMRILIYPVVIIIIGRPQVRPRVDAGRAGAKMEIRRHYRDEQGVAVDTECVCRLRTGQIADCSLP